jgi:hypothetical protein
MWSVDGFKIIENSAKPNGRVSSAVARVAVAPSELSERLAAEPQFNNLFYDSYAVFAVIFGDKGIPSRKDIRRASGMVVGTCPWRIPNRL